MSSAAPNASRPAAWLLVAMHDPAVGYQLQDDDARAIAGPIQELLQDVKGADEVRRSLEEVTRTAFRAERLEAVLAATGGISEWRVGESLAEGCTGSW